MKEKGLGQGLNALFGDDFSLEQQDDAARTMLPLHRVEPNPDQPRKDFDEQELQSLADSLAQHGMISPIAVRDMGNGYYQIIAGERRWRAARLAGFTQIPAVILNVDSRQAAELALVENLQRQDLNPIEEARGYQSLLEQFSLTQAEVAQRVGRSRSAVANTLRLLNLPKEVLDLIEAGRLSAGHARAVLSLSGEDDQLQLAAQIVAQGLSVRQAEALAARMLQPEKPAVQDENAPYWADCCRTLSGALDRKVRIRPGRKKGVVELEYYNLEDFQTLYDALQTLGRREHRRG